MAHSARAARRAALVALILASALALRVAEVGRTGYRPINDAASYVRLAGQIVEHGTYAARDRGAAGSRGPSAYFPPGYPYFLAAVDELAGSSHDVGALRLSQAALGTIIVALVGLVALELFGETTALIALALAAVYPVLLELSALLVAENLMTVLVLAAVWSVLRAQRSTRAFRWLGTAGVLAGLATLTHVNAVVLLAPLGLGALAITNWKGAAMLVAAAALALAPWTIRNAADLGSFIPVSDETGVTLAGTYNPASAADRAIPYGWRFHLDGVQPRRLSEPALDSRLRGDALRYIGDHPLAPLAAALHNTLRMLELEGSHAWRASAASISLDGGTAQLGVIGFWLLCLLAAAGALTGAARAAPRWLWLAPALLALSIVLVNAETPRFREAIDPFLILPAACAMAALGARARGALDGAPVGRERGPAEPVGSAQLIEVVERLA